MALLALDEYYALDDAPSPTENAVQIQNAIDSAIARIENITGRTIELSVPSPIDSTDLLNGLNTGRIYTVDAPILSITSIEVWRNTEWQLIDSVTQPYTFLPDTNIVYFTTGHKLPSGYKNIRILYSYGYTIFPKDLQHACYALAKHMVLESERVGLRTQRDGEQSFSYDHEVPEEIMNVIIKYRTVW